MQEIYKTPGSRKVEIPVSEKYMLTINEAAAYFSIGVKKLRRMAEDNEGKFAITMGSRYLIVREKFEEYIDSLINGESEVEPDEQTDILNPNEAIELFVLSRRKFYKLLKENRKLGFLAMYGSRKLIIRSEFQKYLDKHPELKRRGS